MPGFQDTPDIYPAERILRDIRDLRLKLLDNDQRVLCQILFPLQVNVEDEVKKLQELSAHRAAREVLTQYAHPRLLVWMGIQ